MHTVIPLGRQFNAYMFFSFVVVVSLYYSTAYEILQDEFVSNSSKSVDVKKDLVIQKLLTRLDFLEDRLLAQENELYSLKENCAVDLLQVRNDCDSNFSAITKKFENENRRLDKALPTNGKKVNNLPVGKEEKRMADEETDADDDTPSADQETLVDNVGGNLRNVRTKEYAEHGIHKQRIRRFDSELNVSFFAKIVQNVHHLGQGQNVIFDTVVTNNGNAYNPYLGAFVAPVGGTYMFSTSLVTFDNDTSHYGIFVNNDRITILYVNGVDNNSDSTSQTVILQLNEQDTVTVRHIDSDKSLVGYHHSLFSGVLIAQDGITDSSIIDWSKLKEVADEHKNRMQFEMKPPYAVENIEYKSIKSQRRKITGLYRKG